MKKDFTLIACLLCASVIATSQNSAYRGIWYYQTAFTASASELQSTIVKTINTPNSIPIKGVLVGLPWYQIQKDPPVLKPTGGKNNNSSDGSYDWSYFDSYMNAVYNSSNALYISLMIFAGPDAPVGKAKNDGTSCGRDKTGTAHSDWLTQSQTYGAVTYPGIGWFLTSNSKFDVYPDYLGTNDGSSHIESDEKSRYETYWRQMLSDVAYHILAQPANSYKSKVLFIQSCEGKTGDAEPYIDGNCHPGYTITDKNWYDFQTRSWDWMNGKLAVTGIHLMVNTGVTDRLYGFKDPDNYYKLLYDCYTNISTVSLPRSGSLFDYANGMLPQPWRKATNMGHWYQQNDETKFKGAFDGIKSTTSTSSNVLTRDEADFAGNETAITDPAILFAIAADALNSGLDMWMISFKDLFDYLSGIGFSNLPPGVKGGLLFFDRHVNSYRRPGYTGTADATTAFCYLRKGLDASVDEYGTGAIPCTASSNLQYGYITNATCGSTTCYNDNSTGNAPGMERTACIEMKYASKGAYQQPGGVNQCSESNGGRVIGQGGPFQQFNSSSKYDVGWYTFTDEYSINLKLDPNDISHSTGWWNQQTFSSTQGRFARDVGNAPGAGNNNNKLNFILKNMAIAGTSTTVVINFFVPPDQVTVCKWKWRLMTNEATPVQILMAQQGASYTPGTWAQVSATFTVPASFNSTDDIPDFYIENYTPTTCDNNFRIKFSTIELYP